MTIYCKFIDAGTYEFVWLREGETVFVGNAGVKVHSARDSPPRPADAPGMPSMLVGCFF